MDAGDNKPRHYSVEGDGEKNAAKDDGDESIDSRVNDSNPGSSVGSWDFSNDCFKGDETAIKGSSTKKQKDDDDDDDSFKTIEIPIEEGFPDNLKHIPIHIDALNGMPYISLDEINESMEDPDEVDGKEHPSCGSKKKKKLSDS